MTNLANAVKNIEPGKYVVAVSGGVDSVVLLHLLATERNNALCSMLYAPELIVAHFDHGIRKDSHKDAKLVKKLAKDYGLKFELGKARLGTEASEEIARNARYDFLRQIRNKNQADAIILAHHQDDLLETAVLNLIRKTNYRGLSSLQSTYELMRPMLGFNKKQILEYVKIHNLEWREDSTNSDEKYKRNYVRRVLMPNFTDEQKQQMIAKIEQVTKNRQKIEQKLKDICKNKILDRNLLLHLPYDVAVEVLIEFFKFNRCVYSKRQLDNIIIELKTKPSGTKISVQKDVFLYISQEYVSFGGNRLV